MTRTLRNIIAVVIVLLIVVGGLIQFARPIPAVKVQVNQTKVRLPGQFSVSFPNQGQGAIGEEGLGVVSQSPNEQSVPIASLTKMMTAYLLLKQEPLKPGQNGPTTTITAQDVQLYQEDSAQGDSVVKVQAGEKLTELQLLEGLLLPSGDNIAALIANQLAGSQAAFVKEMNTTAKSLGMTQTTYSDASGVSPATVSTAHDQILIAEAAMQHPVFRQVVQMPQADLPVAGIVYNVNSMVGKRGMTGIKTGSTLEAGGCFVGSYPIMVDGQQHILIGAVLGQQTMYSLQSALTATVNLLHEVAPEFKYYSVPESANGFGQLSTVWKQSSTLQVGNPIKVFGYPGMVVHLDVHLTDGTLPIAAGSKVGTLAVTAKSAKQTVPLIAAQAVSKPSWKWRLFR